MLKKFKNQCAEKDFTEAMLPKNRREVFFDVLKMHWQQLLLMGLILLLFSAPLIIINLFEQFSLNNLATSDMGLSEEQLSYFIFLETVIFEAIKLPCFMIMSVGLAGILRVIRQYAWEENVFLRRDFALGVKENAAQLFLISVMFGVSNWLSVFCVLQTPLAESNVQYFALYIPSALFFLILVPFMMYLAVCTTIYNAKFGMQCKIAFVTFSKHPIKTYLAVLCCAALLALLLIPNSMANIILHLVLPIFYPLVIFGWYLFSLNSLDSAINSEYYPELVGRGTFTQN